MASSKRIEVLEHPFAPTPVVRLSGEYEGNVIYIKRDDLIPFSFGGNKARKAACFYREIQEEKPDVIMTYGSNASNHCRIIANLAAALGLPCHIISSGEEEHGTGGRELFNRVLVRQFGALVETVPVEEVHDTIERRLEEYREQGMVPYFIQGGGHGNAGTQSYVDAFSEIRRQEKELGVSFPYLFHASGTGSTQAGLICGKELQKAPEKIVGISIARPCPRGRDVVRESVLDYFRMLDEKEAERKAADLSASSGEDGSRQERGKAESLFREEDLIFEDGYRLGGYGKSTQEEEDCIRELMLREGIPMDTTYVGKAFFGMLQYLKEHDIRGEEILFLHTGGTPLFFDRL